MDLILIKFLGAELVWNTSNSKIDREIFEILGQCTKVNYRQSVQEI